MSRTEVLTETLHNLFLTQAVTETATRFVWNRNFKGEYNNFFRTYVWEYLRNTFCFTHEIWKKKQNSVFKQTL